MTDANTSPAGLYDPFLFATSGWCSSTYTPDTAQRLLIIHDPAAEEWRVERETMEWIEHENRFARSTHIIAAYGYYAISARAASNRTHQAAREHAIAFFTNLQHWREYAERRGA